MCLTQADGRPAHLTRVRDALTALPEPDQVRLGVIADWKHGPHQPTYRQTERTFRLVADALAEDEPGGLPSGPLQAACDDLLEASVPEKFKTVARGVVWPFRDRGWFRLAAPAPHVRGQGWAGIRLEPRKTAPQFEVRTLLVGALSALSLLPARLAHGIRPYPARQCAAEAGPRW